MAKRRAGSKARKKRVKRAAKKRPRATRVARSRDDQSAWPYSKFVVWSQRWGSPDHDSQTHPTTVLLRHPTAPFVGTGNLDTFEHDLRKVAYEYLAAANNNRLIDYPPEIPSEWLAALDPDGPGPDPALFPSFGWLPIGWPTTDQSVSSLVSFLVFRTNAPEDTPDLMVILLASQKVVDAPTGPEFGIRVVAHVQKIGTKFEVRISGMSASLPFGVFRPALVPQSLTRAARARVRGAARSLTGAAISEFLASSRMMIASMLDLKSDTVAAQGLRFSPVTAGPADKLQVHAQLNFVGQSKENSAGAPGSTDPQPYYSSVVSTTLTLTDKGGLRPGPLSLIRKIELVAEAAQAFPIDPASQGDGKDIRKRRPTRREDVLDNYRIPEPTIPAVLDYAPDGYNDDVVVVCPGFVLDDYGLPPTNTKTVPGGDPQVRSNDASAVMAYWNVEQFFDRLRAYGINPNDYFRVAQLPLEVHYRSGIRLGPGKDGQTVNAQVRVKGFPDNFEGPIPPGQRPIIEMHLALADLSTRARKPWDTANRSPAEPLGIAADARWIWHEVGHVLLTTSVGELQFRFAHSAGDALAAVVSDPESKLATDPVWRGSTFPWVFLPRRHDRCVAVGWSWGGTLHYDLAQVQDSVGPRRKAYWSEQILSSSLFRLYRCIGGDTISVTASATPDLHARRSASHYCVFLIMRAIQILGTSLIVPANEPDQFVSALIDADTNAASSTPWHVIFPPVFPPGPTDTFDRVGGCVHKVIRWAFETQGLYNPLGKITNAPGAPPPVDIYIADRRPTLETTTYGDISYGLGSYNPVSLEWDAGQGQNGPTPAWQATDTAISVVGSNIKVWVGNRGTQPALGVKVDVWWCPWPAATNPPSWNDAAAGWLNTGPSGPQDIGPLQEASFSFSHTPPAKRYVVLAKATCITDSANTDISICPCSYLKTSLVDLVSGDNNIGLRVFKNP
jgi:hypothetical protein